MANKPTDELPAYPPPDKSSVADRFTESWDFKRAFDEMKAKRKAEKDDAK